LPEFWELNQVRPSACTPSTLLTSPCIQAGFDKEALFRKALDRTCMGRRPTPEKH
jgi:hypothetical protein